VTGPRRGSLRLLRATAFVSTADRFAMPPMLIAPARALRVPLAGVALGTAVASVGAGAPAQTVSWRAAFLVAAAPDDRRS
jgi:hypothetical protein